MAFQAEPPKIFCQIVERGPHTELLARRGFYYNLYMSQFQGQEERG
jgi:hypothetical protein